MDFFRELYVTKYWWSIAQLRFLQLAVIIYRTIMNVFLSLARGWRPAKLRTKRTY